MTDYQFALLVGFGVKIAIIASGVAAIFMGYKLFERGVYRGGAGVKVEGWKAVVSMDRGGPGLVFAFFGAIVLVAGIIHPVDAAHDAAIERADEPPNSVPESVTTSNPDKVTSLVVAEVDQPTAKQDPLLPKAPAATTPPVAPHPVVTVHEHAHLGDDRRDLH